MKKLLYLFLLLSTISQIEPAPKRGKRGSKKGTPGKMKKGNGRQSHRGKSSTSSRSTGGTAIPSGHSTIRQTSELKPTSSINQTTTPTEQVSDNPFAEINSDLFDKSKEQKERAGDALQHYTDLEIDISLYENYCNSIKKEINELPNLIKSYNRLKEFTSSKELTNKFDEFLIKDSINTKNLTSLQNQIESIQKLLEKEKTSLKKIFDEDKLKIYKEKTIPAIKKKISILENKLKSIFINNKYQEILKLLKQNKENSSEEFEQKINNIMTLIIEQCQKIVKSIMFNKDSELNKINNKNSETNKINKKKEELNKKDIYAKDDLSLTKEKKKKDATSASEIAKNIYEEALSKDFSRIKYIINNNKKITEINGISYYKITENNKSIKVNIQKLYEDILTSIYMQMVKPNTETLNSYINKIKTKFIELGSLEAAYKDAPIGKAIENIKNMVEMGQERSIIRENIKKIAMENKNTHIEKFFGIQDENLKKMKKKQETEDENQLEQNEENKKKPQGEINLLDLDLDFSNKPLKEEKEESKNEKKEEQAQVESITTESRKEERAESADANSEPVEEKKE